MSPHRLLAGPWVHADPTTAYPGPRLDLDVEMAAWFDRWLREGPAQESRVDLFVRTTTRPAPFLDQHEGYWITDTWPSAATRPESRELAGPRSLVVRPDVGTAAWIDCAGHLPWGLSGDQRSDDAYSLTFDWPAADEVIVGHPSVRLRLSADAPAASLSVKLCDVFDDGTSALVSRGSLDLAYRAGVHRSPAPLVPGEEFEVVLELDACAYAFSPGQTLRLSVAGADWPNTIAPPAPVTLTVHSGRLELPLYLGSPRSAPAFAAGEPSSSEDPEGVSWTVTRDVLRDVTTCAVDHGSAYEIPHGTAFEHYSGRVAVDNKTFAQHATAAATFGLTWPAANVSVRVTSTMRVDVGPTGYDVAIDATAYDGDTLVSHREWREHIPR